MRKQMLIPLLSASLIGVGILTGCANNEANDYNQAKVSSYYKAHPDKLKQAIKARDSAQNASASKALSSKNAKILSMQGMSSSSTSSSIRHEVVKPKSKTGASTVTNLTPAQKKSKQNQVDAIVKILKQSNSTNMKSKSQWYNVLQNQNINNYSTQNISDAFKQYTPDFDQAALRKAKNLSGSKASIKKQLQEAKFTDSQIDYAMQHLD